MSTPLVECVPNFSEGRNSDLIDEIVNSARGVDGCLVLSAEPDADYNRTVVTLAGLPGPVAEAAYQLISSAKSLIDMQEHEGEHPRMGAVDVCPFIPLRDSTMDECAALATRLGERVSQNLAIPVYFYGHAAKHPDRKVLSALRKGQYEGLKGRLSNSDSVHSEQTRLPDLGPTTWTGDVAKSGAIAIGARPILVAYNVNLDEKDAAVSRKIGTIVRSSGRLIKQESGKKMRVSGMLDCVQGMGIQLESHGISQVSMNLLDISVTDLHDAFECIRSLAADHGIKTAGSELVGLAPLSSFLEAGKWYHIDPDNASDDELVEAAVEGLGLDSMGPFEASGRIIEWAVEAST